MRFLKEATQVVISVGTFFDLFDGVTPETGITLGAADRAIIVKQGSAASVDVSARTWAAVTNGSGEYNITLTTSDTDTLGSLRLRVDDADVCLPVSEDFMVVPANVYDSLFSTDKLQVDLTQIDGTANASATLTLTSLAAPITGNITGNLSGSVGSVTGAINTAAGTVTTLDGLVGADSDTLETLSDQADAIKLKTDLITVGGVEVASPVASDETVEIVAGDDYASADSTAVTFTVTGYAGPSLTSATVRMAIVNKDEYDAGSAAADLTITGTGVVADGTATFTFELTAAQTDGLNTQPPQDSYSYVYQVTVETSGGNLYTVALGAMNVRGNVTNG